MKLTKSQIKQLIKEELENVLNEQQPAGGVTSTVGYEQEPAPAAPAATKAAPQGRPQWHEYSRPAEVSAGPATVEYQQKILDVLWAIRNRI